MAVYKASYCYPFNNSYDIRVTGTDDVKWLKCKVDTSNKDITGYTIRILDGDNNQIFPYNNEEGTISPISELTALNLGDNINTGINGSYLQIPFFQNEYLKDLFSYNAIYSVIDDCSDYMISDLQTHDADFSGNWTLLNDFLEYTGDEENWVGILNGDIISENDRILVLDPNATNKNGIWKMKSWGVLEKITSLDTGYFIIKKGIYHNKTYFCDGQSLSETTADWVDYYNRSIPNLSVEGQTYKWEITLYQGEGIVIPASGSTPASISYSNIDNKWLDMTLSSGTILGSTSKRIQIASDSNASINDDTLLPAGTPTEPLVLQSRWIQLLDNDNNYLGSSARVQTYDSSYGHVYPTTDSFDLGSVQDAEKVAFFKHSSNEEYITDQDTVVVASNVTDTASGNYSGGNVSYLYGEWNTIPISFYVPDKVATYDSTNELYKISLESDGTLDGGTPIINDTILCTYNGNKKILSVSEVCASQGGTTRVFGITANTPLIDGYPAGGTFTVDGQNLSNVSIDPVGEGNVATVDSSNHSKINWMMCANTANTRVRGLVTYTYQDPNILVCKRSDIIYTSNNYYEILKGNNKGLIYQNGVDVGSVAYPGLFVMGGHQLVDGETVLLKDQVNPWENGVYIAHSTGTSWQRSGSYLNWGSFIGKILYIRYGYNAGTNWESQAMAGGSLWYADNLSSNDGQSPLLFIKEKPLLLFPSLLTASVTYKDSSINWTQSGSVYTASTIYADQGLLSVGNTILSDTAVYTITLVNTAENSVTATYQSISTFLGMTTVNRNYYVYITDGYINGKTMNVVAGTIASHDITKNDFALRSAYILKNSQTYTYISAYSGLVPQMKLKLLNNKTVTYTSSNVFSSWITINSLNKTVWRITHNSFTTPLLSMSESDSSVPYKYEVRSYFRASDENPFYSYEEPYLTIGTSYESSTNANGLTWSTGSETYPTTCGYNLQQTSYVIPGEYHQGQQASWESYRWVLTDELDNVLQDTGLKYNSDIAFNLYGLLSDMGTGATDTKYTATLYVTDSIGNSIVKSISLDIDLSSWIESTGINMSNDCSTHSVLLAAEDNVLTNNYSSLFKREYKSGWRFVYYNGVARYVDQTFKGPWQPVILQVDNLTSLRDFNITNGRNYQYLWVTDPSSNNNCYSWGIDGTSNELETNWSEWTLTELIPQNNTLNSPLVRKQYKADLNNIWLFRYKLETGSQTQNITKNEFQTLAQFSRFGYGKNNYISGEVSCLLGSEIIPYSKESYIERTIGSIGNILTTNDKILMLKQWRSIVSSHNPKLLTDIKGQSWIVQIISGSNTPYNYYKNQPDTISFSWKQIDDVSNIIINGDGDSLPNTGTDNCPVSLIIPSDIATLTSNYFDNLQDKARVNSIIIPETVTNIQSGALKGFVGLSSITLPFIGSMKGNTGTNASLFGYIFGTSSYIGGVATDQYYSSNQHTTYYIPSSLRTVIITDETLTGYGAFSNCSNLTSVTIPDSVTSIGDSAFSGCLNLKSVSLSNTITSIGNNAFSNCSSLTSVIIPDSVISIGDYAFDSCSSLTSIVIPDSVTSIGVGAFSGCSSLTSITIPDSVTSIGDSAFDSCSSLTSITIPDSVTEMGSDVFFSCEHLRNITLSSALTAIGGGTFESCFMLDEVILPSPIISIGDYAFSDCSSLTSITLNDNLTLIGEGAFYNCTSLTSITIPDSVTSIGRCAFYNCSNLDSIIFNQSSSATLTLPSAGSVDGMLYSTVTRDMAIYYSGNSVITNYNYMMDNIRVTLWNTPVLSVSGSVLSWNVVFGATEYDIYKDQLYQTSISSTSFDINTLGLVEGTYSFYIRAVNDYGEGGIISNSVEYTVIPAYITFSSPLTFTLATANTSKNWDGTLEYSTDTINWSTWEGALISAVLSNGTYNLYLRGKNNRYMNTSSLDEVGRWILDGSLISCSGNIENLLDYSIVLLGDHPATFSDCFKYLFAHNTSLKSAPEIPLLSVSSYAFYYMFYNCTELMTAPSILPATTLNTGCYDGMFAGCTSLVQCPSISFVGNPLTTFIGNYMFYNCTSLETLPKIKMTAINNDCLNYMFCGCTKIKLSATQTGIYQTPYVIPITGDGTAGTSSMTDMFKNTGGTFTGSPTINTIYYTSNTLV